VCCALPALFISLGMGASFASLVSHVPALVWLSEYKIYFFIMTAIFLSLGFYMLFIYPQSCPPEKDLAIACQDSKKVSKIVFILSAIIFIIAVFFSYIYVLIV